LAERVPVCGEFDAYAGGAEGTEFKEEKGALAETLRREGKD
jgi:uncharacterized protein YbbK (DUF523 family)